MNLNLAFWERLLRYLMIPLLAALLYMLAISRPFQKMVVIANPGASNLTKHVLVAVIIFFIMFIATLLTENLIVDAATEETTA